MSYIETVSDSQAEGRIVDEFDSDRARLGYVANYTRLFGLRLNVMEAWQQLAGAVTENLGLRNYELVTLAAAKELGSSYCSLAHGKILATKVFDPETVTAIVKDIDNSGLSPAEVAMMSFAARVANDALSIEQGDIDSLRTLGFSDVEIFDFAAAAAARSFFSKVLDAMGAEPDPGYLDLDEEMRDALTVGRPIATGDAAS